MKSTSLTLVTQRTSNIGLAIAWFADGIDSSSVITLGNGAGSRNTFAIGLQRVADISWCTFLTTSPCVTFSAGVTCGLIVVVQEASVRKPPRCLSVWTWTGFAVIVLSSTWVTEESRLAFFTLSSFSFMLTTQAVSTNRVTGTGMTIAVAASADAQIRSRNPLKSRRTGLTRQP